MYLAAFLELIPFPAKIQTEIIPVLPFWVIVSFGAYLLFSLGMGVLTFKDTESAYDELVSVRSSGVERVQRVKHRLTRSWLYRRSIWLSGTSGRGA